MELYDDKAVVLRLQHPEKVTTLLPESKLLNDGRLAVKWGVEEAQTLNDINIDVPSPITKKYSWTGKHKPFSHQKETAAFFTLNKRGFCFNEQGTGKTASAIWAADFLMKQKLVRRVLIICPLSIMHSAWKNDLFTFAMHRKVDIAHGAPKKREQIVKSDAEFIIINYDGVEVVYDAIANGGFDLIIVDEATHYKNAQTKRWKTLNKLVTPDTWLWMMTGTPAAQSPLDGLFNSLGCRYEFMLGTVSILDELVGY